MRLCCLVVGLLFVESLSWAHAAAAASRAEARPAAVHTQTRDLRPVEKFSPDPQATRDLSPELIKKTIQRYLESEWGTKVKTVHVILLEPSDPLKLPAGVIELQVVPSASEEGLGRRVFHITVRTNGRPWSQIEALTDVSALIDAVVPSRYLKAEEIMGADDLTTARIRIPDLKHPFITNPEEAIGMSAARPLSADLPLRATFLKKPFLVKKGDRVMIEARRGGLSIQTSGVTKSSGQVGQFIMVANLDSGRELRAKVMAPGLVQVDF